MGDSPKDAPQVRLKQIHDEGGASSPGTSRAQSHSRNRSSAPTPASRSPSGRRAAPRSSPARPLRWRQRGGARFGEAAVCGYGRAEKDHGAWSSAVSALAEVPWPHHAAGTRLAVAICHALAPPLVALREAGDDRPPAGAKPVVADADGLVLDVEASATAVRDAGGVAQGRRRRGAVLETHLHAARTPSSLRASPTQASGSSSSGCSLSPASAPKSRSRSSPATAMELKRAIVREDAALFQTIPGIGKKTAQRVVLELKERIAPLAARRRGAAPRPR